MKASKPIILPVIRPNVGLEKEYQKKLERMIDEMEKSVAYWILAAYRQDTPHMAQDASPATILSLVMKKLAKKWNKRFADVAPIFAKYFATSVRDRTDSSLKAALKKSGFTVEFKLTKEINDILQASVKENVSLIKSISQEYLNGVEQAVMRSVTVGRDLGGLKKELMGYYDTSTPSLARKAKKRAKLIARQSNNNAFAMIKRARETELGVTEAVWVHSHAGKVPRPEHERWGKEQKRYNIATGIWSEVSKKFVWPGTDFNCRCTGRPVLPHLGKAAGLPSNLGYDPKFDKPRK